MYIVDTDTARVYAGYNRYMAMRYYRAAIANGHTATIVLNGKPYPCDQWGDRL